MHSTGDSCTFDGVRDGLMQPSSAVPTQPDARIAERVVAIVVVGAVGAVLVTALIGVLISMANWMWCDAQCSGHPNAGSTTVQATTNIPTTPAGRGSVTGTIISHADLALRSRPSIDDESTIIKRIPIGATVTVYCQVSGPPVQQDDGYDNNRWNWIEYNNSKGYIAAALVDTGADTSTQVDQC
jgi:hypothetical protein